MSFTFKFVYRKKNNRHDPAFEVGWVEPYCASEESLGGNFMHWTDYNWVCVARCKNPAQAAKICNYLNGGDRPPMRLPDETLESWFEDMPREIVEI